MNPEPLRLGRRVGGSMLRDVSSRQLTQIGGTGVFVSALRESLLRREVDFAVHSLEDHAVVLDARPVTPPPGAVDPAAANGTIVIRESGEADAGDAAPLGRELATRMLALGAADLMRADDTDGDDAHD